MIPTGLKLIAPDLVEQLHQFRTKRANEIARRALAAGARLVANAMKAYAPRDTGLLAKSMGSKASTSRSVANKSYAIAGPRRGMGGYVTSTARGRKLLKAASVANPTRGQLKRFRDPTKYARLAARKKDYRARALTTTQSAVEAAIRDTMARLIASSFTAKHLVGGSP